MSKNERIYRKLDNKRDLVAHLTLVALKHNNIESAKRYSKLYFVLANKCHNFLLYKWAV